MDDPYKGLAELISSPLPKEGNTVTWEMIEELIEYWQSEECREVERQYVDAVYREAQRMYYSSLEIDD